VDALQRSVDEGEAPRQPGDALWRHRRRRARRAGAQAR
jgi:hypothetical protein